MLWNMCTYHAECPDRLQSDSEVNTQHMIKINHNIPYRIVITPSSFHFFYSPNIDPIYIYIYINTWSKPWVTFDTFRTKWRHALLQNTETLHSHGFGGLGSQDIPRGSIYTTIREFGPKIPHYRRNYGPNSLMVIYVDPLGS